MRRRHHRLPSSGSIDVCKLYAEFPFVCVSGVTGANLNKRIRAVLAEYVAENLTLTKKATLTFAGIAALTLPIVVGAFNAFPPRAQSTASSRSALQVIAAPQDSGPEVADVELSPPSANPKAHGGGGGPSGGGFTLRSATMVDLISFAWGVEREKVVGGPTWLAADRFDVTAYPPSPTVGIAQTKSTFRAILQDRFKLVVHPDVRPIQAFALTVDRGGPSSASSSMVRFWQE